MSGAPAEWVEAVGHYQAGRLAEAEAACRRLLQRVKDQPEALGLLAAAVQQQGRAAEAETLFARVTVLQPGQARAWNNLANSQAEQGKGEAAVASYRRALALQPDYAAALKNLGQTLRELDRSEEALEAYRRAVGVQPDYAEAHLGLGLTLARLDRREEAVSALHRAIAVKPDYAEAYNNLGNLLRAQDLAEAIAAYERAIVIHPNFAEAHSNLGFALRDSGRLEEAVAHCNRALELDSTYAAARTNLALALLDQGRVVEATHHLRAALAQSPSSPEANDIFAGILKDQGRVNEAIETYKQVLRNKPDFATAHSNLIFALDLMPGVDFADQQSERRRWWEAHGARFAPAVIRHTNVVDPARQLRVGYVSADFKRHSAAYCFGPVLRRHDRSQFRVTCYSGVSIPDDFTQEFRNLSDQWRSTVGVDDTALAEQIKADGIDILVDLSAHSRGNRLLTFARKPAPVQVTAWGHANGTGVATIDYLFSDPTHIPDEARKNYSETVCDLPCVITYEAASDAPEVASLPAKTRNHITFGCFNRLAKVTEPVVVLWSRILGGVSNSRIIVKDGALDNDAARKQLLDVFTRHGIGEDKVVLRGATPHREHLQAFSEIDIALDPFPQNGGISTFDALWMGVPVVALLGNSGSSRVAGAILDAVGLRDWVAEDAESYVRLAVERALDPDRLEDLRRTLRARVGSSAAGNAASYTRAVEAAYRRLWSDWCDRQR